MNEMINKYIEDLEPELREKAMACKTNDELMEFLAENDIELPEEALEAVSGGGGNDPYAVPLNEGDIVPGKTCPLCHEQLYYFGERVGQHVLYCENRACRSYFRESPVTSIVYFDQGSSLRRMYLHH
ncbi:MAG: hypothetical protein J6O40_05935 [Ruminococcus sp.]|nr:hypothetical protein [Ruminococcus sp.]